MKHEEWKKSFNPVYTCRKDRLQTRRSRLTHAEQDQSRLGFKCLNCGAYVHCDATLAGVHNRNHCPYCLCSKHVDLYMPGDRLAACKALMKPVGLSMKKTNKKYGCRQGELMVIHLCSVCGSISVNRIAADDDARKLLQIYTDSIQAELAPFWKSINDSIQPLGTADARLVIRQLFGEI